MPSMNDTEDKISELEERAFQIDIIESFAHRGWALYECNTETRITLLSDLQPIVEMGRAKEKLQIGAKYILLPFHHDDANWNTIKSLALDVVSKGRGPYYLGIVEGHGEITPTSSFLIDSVVLNPPFLYLVPDPQMSRIADPSRVAELQGKAIEIPLWELWRIRKQLMMALR